MKLDSIALSSVIFEINQKLIPAKIVDLNQISKFEFSLGLKNNTSNGRLFFSIRPDRMAFFLSHSPIPKENFSSLFFNQLQNWVQGGTLLSIEHFKFDRIVKLMIEPYNTFGPAKNYQLIIELMGKHSNAILVDEQNNIKASLKQVGSDINRYREVKAGIPYVYPPTQEKANPLTISRREFFELLNQDANSEKTEYLWQFFQKYFNGIGMKSSREMAAAMGFPAGQALGQIPEQNWPDLWNQFLKLNQKILTNHLSPVVLIDQDNNKMMDYFLLHPMKEIQNVLVLPFQDTSACLEYVYNRLTEEEKKQNLYLTINKTLKKNLEKLEEKERFLENRKREIDTIEEYKKKGGLIKANLWNIKPDIDQITLIDYSDLQQPRITVNLDPALTPIQNAEIYFKKYRKLQQNRELTEAQREENQESLNQLREIQKKLSENLNSLENLSSVYDELVRLKYIQKETPVAVRRKTDQAPAISRFLSPDGWTILVGKNSKQNEYILRYLSSGNDFWLHNLTRPGGHVIIKNHRNLESPPYPTLVFAAKLAGYFSKTKDKENALIIYTLRKYVKKPKNAKMGKVIYTNEKTLTVVIDHHEIKKEIRRLMDT